MLLVSYQILEEDILNYSPIAKLCGTLCMSNNHMLFGENFAHFNLKRR